MKTDPERITEPYVHKLLALSEAGDEERLREEIAQIPEPVKGPLGYTASLLSASLRDGDFTYMGASRDALTRVINRIPRQWYPIHGIGWGGAKNEIGPAYAIRKEQLVSGRLFYTDEDIKDHPDYAKKLALAILKESSGLSEMRLEKIDTLYTLGGSIPGPHCCITFSLKQENLREVLVNQQTVHSKDAIFLLARAGEFECMMGEWADPNHALVLLRHSYCMK